MTAGKLSDQGSEANGRKVLEQLSNRKMKIKSGSTTVVPVMLSLLVHTLMISTWLFLF